MKAIEAFGVALLLLALLILFRTKSFADSLSPGPSPGPSPAGLLVGAILSKQPSETCVAKYGPNWAEVTPTLCAKTS